jgi:hypothetical protein
MRRSRYGGQLLFFLAAVNLCYGIVGSWYLYFLSYYLEIDLHLQPATATSKTGMFHDKKRSNG